MSASAPLLAVKHLSADFVSRHGAARALHDVSFEISRGEVLGVVGESGAGKSLTGRAVVGLIDPPGHISGGEIWFEGERIDTLPARRMRALRGRRIATIFQDPLTSLDPLQTVGSQLVETIRTHLPMPGHAARHRAIALLTEVGIPSPAERIDGWPHEFSGGMRQRVVIALALAGEPDLLIADEPTTALDVSVQAQIIALLRDLARKRALSVMLVTHDMGVIAQTADRVAVMYAGRIVEVGPVRDVIARPLHPYTRGLMSAIPSAKVRASRLVHIPGSMPRPGARLPGCAFAPRCAEAIAPCREAVPPLGRKPHAAACFVEDPPA